jgi:hypothetical protein
MLAPSVASSMAGRVLLLVALVVLAGCIAFSGSPTSGPDAPAPAVTDPNDVDDTRESSALVVGIDAPGSRTFEPPVRRALAYWERNAERYADAPMTFRLAPDAADPDVTVAFVPTIDDCGAHGHTAGCAPLLTDSATADDAEVRVLDDLSNASTSLVVEHEIGHVLGLDHGDAPQAVMAPRTTLTTRPEPDASERALPWASSTLSVFVERRTGSNASGTESTVGGRTAPGDRTAGDRTAAGERGVRGEQIEHALDYYARGAGGTVPENVSFERAASPANADVVVRFAEHSPCGSDRGSCGSVLGTDPDGDGALETHTKLTITLTDLDGEAVGWHVARWLGYGFGLDGREYPPVLRESASYGERRSAWWSTA